MATWTDFQGPTFALLYPSDWLVSSNADLQAIFLGPVLGQSRPTMTISLRPIEDGLSAPQIALATRQSQQANYAEYQVLEEIDFTAQGGFSYLRRYQWRHPESGLMLLQTQLFIVYGRLLYILTTTIDLGSANVAQPILDQMLKSLRLRPLEQAR